MSFSSVPLLFVVIALFWVWAARASASRGELTAGNLRAIYAWLGLLTAWAVVTTLLATSGAYRSEAFYALLPALWLPLAPVVLSVALLGIWPSFRTALWTVTTQIPDSTTLLNFRHLLEQHELGAAVFAKVGELLQANGMELSGGTIVDATLIAAPPSTKNEEQSRDPEMHQSKKGNQWYFGMKVHIGVDSASGLIHSASVTPGNVHDSHELPNLLHGMETRLYGDSAYRGEKQRQRLKELAPKARDFTNKRAHKNRPLSEADKQTNRRKSAVRSKVEHPFLGLKRLWGFAKVRYRGLAKNANRAFAMLAMLNIVKWGRPLTGQVRPA